jgi:hypothetical protein
MDPATQCDMCRAGSISVSENKSTTCIECAAGFASSDPQTSANVCELCQVGTFADVGASTCSACTPGTADEDADPSTPCTGDPAIAEPTECIDFACPADLNRNGLVETVDLLILLAKFNRSSCEFNVVGSARIDTEDLLALLTEFGRPC